MKDINVIFALKCSFSYFALVMSHFTCLHFVLLITAGSKRCAHVKLPLASKYISGRHNVLNRKHRPICQQLIKYSYYTSSTRNWKGSPSSVCIKKLIIRKKKQEENWGRRQDIEFHVVACSCSAESNPSKSYLLISNRGTLLSFLVLIFDTHPDQSNNRFPE